MVMGRGRCISPLPRCLDARGCQVVGELAEGDFHGGQIAYGHVACGCEDDGVFAGLASVVRDSSCSLLIERALFAA